ncbi:GRAS family protein RAM1-like [Coffea arabica]|uniref:GRAS family protein RAM1-like n=1 Tax=Coffea arabica TaxID=13443 RepID=A0ABM4UE92_COFAR
MEAFAVRHECPLELLKITAGGTCEETMEKTGKQLSSFAQTINLPFSFKVVASDLKDLKEEFFDLEANEAVAIDLAYQLWSLLAWPNHLEALMAVIQNLKPCFLVLKEVEVCTNAPNFLEPFKETLLFISGLIDSMNSCMEKHILYRKPVEEVHWWGMIHNVLTAEGTERTLRHERIGFWRFLFKKFGFVESDLSQTSILQANLTLKRSDQLRPGTSVMDGKSLIFRWNETSFQSISAWEFPSD